MEINDNADQQARCPFDRSQTIERFKEYMRIDSCESMSRLSDSRNLMRFCSIWSLCMIHLQSRVHLALPLQKPFVPRGFHPPSPPFALLLVLAESHARVIRAGKSENVFSKSAGPLHFYLKEIPRICQNEILFWQIRRRE